MRKLSHSILAFACMCLALSLCCMQPTATKSEFDTVLQWTKTQTAVPAAEARIDMARCTAQGPPQMWDLGINPDGTHIYKWRTVCGVTWYEIVGTDGDSAWYRAAV